MSFTSADTEVNFKNAVWEILVQQWKDQKFCDLIVYLKDGEIQIHAWLVFGLCPHLIEVSSMARKPVHYLLHLKQFTMESFKRVASYIYKGDIFIDSTDIMHPTSLNELLDLASYLQLADLKSLCQKYTMIDLNTNDEAQTKTEYNDIEGETNVNNSTNCFEMNNQAKCRTTVKSEYNTRSKRKPVTQCNKFTTAKDDVDEDYVVPHAMEEPCKELNSNKGLATDSASCNNNLDVCLSIVKKEVGEDPSDSLYIPSLQPNFAKIKKRKRRRGRLDSESHDGPCFCHVCGMEFSKGKDLSEHKQTEHLRKCSACGLEVYTDVELADHYMNEHKNDTTDKQDTVKPEYKCFTCDAYFVTSHERSLHEKESHDIEIYTCDICGVQYHHKYHLTRHKQSKHFHNDHLKCRLCDHGAFNTETQLRTHFKNTHCGEKPFKCDFPGCQFSGNRFESVTKHKGIHDTLYSYSCEKCGKSCSQMSGLVSHYKTCYHKQQYLCDICGKPFNHSQSMRSHRKSQHFGEKPFTCDLCGKKFTDHRNLKRHKRIHEKAFPYCCEFCGKCYRHSNSLKAHMKKHEKRGTGNGDELTRNKADVLFTQSLSWTSTEKAVNNLIQVNT